MKIGISGEWRRVSSWAHIFIFLCGAVWTILPPPLLETFSRGTFIWIIMGLALVGLLGEVIIPTERK